MPHNKDTVCKDCAFAQYDDVTQIGCKFNLIDKFKESGSTVIEAYDEDSEFYVIKDRACPYKRSEKWKDRVPDDKVELMLTQETNLPFHCILYASNSIKKNKKSIVSIKDQELKPAQITVIREHGNTVVPGMFKEWLDDTTCMWRLENLFLKKDRDQVNHQIAKRVNFPYYLVMEGGDILPSDFLSNINKFVIKELRQFSMIKYENCFVVPMAVHYYAYTMCDFTKTIIENIEELQCQDKKNKMIFKYQEIQKIIRS